MPGASGANTISRSTVHVVNGSQKIASNSTTHSSDNNNYALIHIENVNININVGEANVWVISLGLFGQGDAMNMRCT
jgi:hypothetical protein